MKREPKDLKYTQSHEWIDTGGNVGISDHAQKEITDVVFVELPNVGRDVKKGEACTVVESVKAAFDIYAPVSGKIEAVNDEVVKNPAIINQSPHDDGWLFKIAVSQPAERSELMTFAAYEEFLKAPVH